MQLMIDDLIIKGFLITGIIVWSVTSFVGEKFLVDFMMYGLILILTGFIGYFTKSSEVSLIVFVIFSILYLKLIRQHLKKILSKPLP